MLPPGGGALHPHTRKIARAALAGLDVLDAQPVDSVAGDDARSAGKPGNLAPERQGLRRVENREVEGDLHFAFSGCV